MARAGADAKAGKKRKPGSFEALEEAFSLSATTVRTLLKEKRPGTFTIEPEASVLDALRVMAEENIGALIVVEDERVAGVISERDYARKVILIGKASKDTHVRDIMSSPAITVAPTTTVGECMRLITTSHIRHLPVVQDGELLGCVSIGDVVKAIIAEQHRVIGQLEAYVSGAYPT